MPSSSRQKLKSSPHSTTPFPSSISQTQQCCFQRQKVKFYPHIPVTVVVCTGVNDFVRETDRRFPPEHPQECPYKGVQPHKGHDEFGPSGCGDLDVTVRE